MDGWIMKVDLGLKLAGANGGLDTTACSACGILQECLKCTKPQEIKNTGYPVCRTPR